uniref:Doublecortin domain-containing protein n=1 Tax=Strongyloides papillosus TaxID=174720 RepID=A0A0N5BEQ1_STREA
MQLQDANVDKGGFNNIVEVADGVSELVTDSGNNKKKVKMKTETVVTSKPWEGYIMDCDDEIRTREASWNIEKLAVEGVNKPKDEKHSYNEPNLLMGCRVQIRNHKDRSKFTSKYGLKHIISGKRKKSYFVKCIGKKGKLKLLHIGDTKFDAPVGDCVSAEGRSKSSNDLYLIGGTAASNFDDK